MFHFICASRKKEKNRIYFSRIVFRCVPVLEVFSFAQSIFQMLKIFCKLEKVFFFASYSMCVVMMFIPAACGATFLFLFFSVLLMIYVMLAIFLLNVHTC
jgi:hypothetical protein